MSKAEPGLLPSRRAILKGSLAGGVLAFRGSAWRRRRRRRTGPPLPRQRWLRRPPSQWAARRFRTTSHGGGDVCISGGRGSGRRRARPFGVGCIRETAGAIYEGQTGDIACDHYHRFKEDVALMRRLLAKAYRFSVSWTRVLPEGTGTQNPKGFDFYHRLLDELGKAGVQPMCTLFHSDFPQALYRRVGWLNRDAASWFADYAALVADKLGDRVKHWITLNEPQSFVGMGHRDGVHAPGDKLNDPQYLTVAHNALRAHGKGVRALRVHGKPGAEIGYALGTQGEACPDGVRLPFRVRTDLVPLLLPEHSS